MRIKETKVYHYSELSDTAKAKARDWFREASAGDEFGEFVIEDAERMGEMLGIEFATHSVPLMGGKTRQEPNLYWSGFYSQGDGASFEGRYRFAKDAVTKITAETTDKELIRIASALELLQTAYNDAIACSISHRGRYYHSNTMQFDFAAIETEQDGETISDDLPATAQEDVAQLMRDFADWFWDNLRKEYEFQNSDEQVAEQIIANEYEFTEEGERC